jgi:hypothetical protein
MGGTIAKSLGRKKRQVLRIGAISGDNEADILWEPSTGKLAVRYWNEDKQTEVSISRSFKSFAAPAVTEAMKNLDKLAVKGMDGEAIGLLKDMVGKMRGLLPAPKEDDKRRRG